MRQFLSRLDAALTGLGDVFRGGRRRRDAVRRRRSSIPSSTSSTATPQASQAAVRLVLAQPGISSQLVDNLNASIHLRALLTDIFLVDEVLKGQG